MTQNVTSGIKSIDGGILAPVGFIAAGVSAGIKKADKLDMALLVAKDGPVPSAAVFTTSSMAAPPVVLSRQNLTNGKTRAIVVNSGNANACTGEQGMADARAMAAKAAEEIGCDASDVIVASTGVIGVPLPMDAVLEGISAAASALSAEGADAAAEAILTTDTSTKQAAVKIEVEGVSYTLGGMAKGSGMIMPNMATMLGFLTCDAPLTAEACDAALRSAVEKSFNRITVDGDTSTNDMVTLMASGAAGGESIGPDHPAFVGLVEALTTVCTELAHMIVRDGEGATKFVAVTVRGAVTVEDARDAAMSIANSPLFKTALFGGDANWGRVAMAVGKSAAQVDPSRLDIVFAGIKTCEGGMAVAFDEAEADAALAAEDIDVIVDLNVGECESTVWTCDLSYEYVRINGEYRT